MMNPSSSSISDTIIDNTVVFPSLVEYIESIRFLPLEEQARRITDPVTQKRIKFPLYCLGRLWERRTIKDLLSDATTTRNGYFLHPVTGQQVSSRIVIDSFPPTANCYIKGVKQLLPPPDDETDDESIEEEVKTMSTDTSAAAKNASKTFSFSRKAFPVVLHTESDGQAILTSILQLGKAGGWTDTFIHGSRAKFLKKYINNWFDEDNQGFLSQ
jgi:hypothetical protein